MKRSIIAGFLCALSSVLIAAQATNPSNLNDIVNGLGHNDPIKVEGQAGSNHTNQLPFTSSEFSTQYGARNCSS